MKDKAIVGIDEAGRGPLAGPIVIGVVAVKSKAALRNYRDIRDSKQLSEKQREQWFHKIKNDREVAYGVAFSQSFMIDRHGLTRVVRTAIKRCLKRLEKKGHIAEHTTILLDGLLSAPKRFHNQKTIIGGDESEPVIAMASICAKVLRDRKMARLAKIYPEYGFDLHKGYGTKSHYLAIQNFGLSPIHRRLFLRSWTLTMAGKRNGQKSTRP